jgi:hypothetical protein
MRDRASWTSALALFLSGHRCDFSAELDVKNICECFNSLDCRSLWRYWYDFAVDVGHGQSGTSGHRQWGGCEC